MKLFLPLRKLLPPLIAFTAAAGLLFAATEPVPVNDLCPVTGKEADSTKTVAYSKDVKFCCDVCRKSFNQSPDAKVKEIAAVTPETAKCLMCDKPADKQFKQTYLRVVAVSDDSCVPVFKSSPDKFIVFAVTHPRAVNTVCPISGEKVDPGCTASYQKEVLFCCQVCQDDFNKAQDAHAGKVAGFERTKETCLMCKAKFDTDHMETYRRTVAFSSKIHAGAFKADPDAHIAKAVHSAQ